MGKGAFGDVYRAHDLIGGLGTVAIKRIRKVSAAGQKEAIEQEVEIMRNLNHDGIVKLLDFTETLETYCIVLELISGGDILDKVIRLTYFSEDLSRHVIAQVEQALHYLHDECGIVHRDIKPENILFSPIPFLPLKCPEPNSHSDQQMAEGQFILGIGAGGIGKIKIADFGLSKVVWNMEATSPCGTAANSAPEIIQNKPYSKQVDLWSLGCLLYTLLCGFQPFRDENLQDLRKQVTNHQYAFVSPWWDDISEDARDLVASLLIMNPTERFTCKKVKAHPWMIIRQQAVSQHVSFGLSDNHCVSNTRNGTRYSMKLVVACLQRYACPTTKSRQDPKPGGLSYFTDSIMQPIKESDTVIIHDKVDENESEVIVLTAKEIGSNAATTNVRIERMVTVTEGYLDTEGLHDTMVAEYVIEIFNHLRHLEDLNQPDVNYIEHQQYLKWDMRRILVDWLIHVCTTYHLPHETLFLTVNITDRFLSRRVVEIHHLQLVGITALLIASKYEERRCSRGIDFYCHLTGNAFTKTQILHAERSILTSLDYDLSFPNPMSFLRRISKADNYNIETQSIGRFLMATSLLDYRCIKYRPSQVAAASMYLARTILGRGEWDMDLIHYSGYSETDLEPIFKLMTDSLARPVIHDQTYARKHFFHILTISRQWASKHATSLGIDVTIPSERADYEADVYFECKTEVLESESGEASSMRLSATINKIEVVQAVNA
ncbi:uncharacterized protein RAG0_02921 [Rhynchosporium agropyri]|uniref:Protein kinase domain-containing protein n=1 Tax=Rhynchosporium agropyri TaxID=914238 RepID=A0A1E1K2S9_9HELO|nr:uncharacterized protein RAG0_02921 [Rhynchosporium agropyri]